MSHPLVLRRSLFVLAATAAAAWLPLRSHAHGSMVVPESRIYHCFRSNPENPTDPNGTDLTPSP